MGLQIPTYPTLYEGGDTNVYISSSDKSLTFVVQDVYDQFVSHGMRWLFPEPLFTVHLHNWLGNNFDAKKFIQKFNRNGWFADFEFSRALMGGNFTKRDVVIEGELEFQAPATVRYKPNKLTGLYSYLVLGVIGTGAIPISAEISNYFKQIDISEFLLGKGYYLWQIVQFLENAGLKISDKKPWFDKMNRLLLAQKRPLELSAAIIFNNETFVRSSLEHGASARGHIETGDYQGHTMIGCAVQQNQPGNVRALLQFGAEPNQFLRFSDGYAGSPVTYALRKNFMAVAAALIEAGAAVNQTFPASVPFVKSILVSTFTPLLYAVLKNDTKLVSALLEKGANPYFIEDQLGVGVFAAATSNKNPLMIEALCEKVSDEQMQNCASIMEKSAYDEIVLQAFTTAVASYKPVIIKKPLDQVPVVVEKNEPTTRPIEQFSFFTPLADSATKVTIQALRRAVKDKNVKTVSELYDLLPPDAKNVVPAGLHAAITRLMKRQPSQTIELKEALCGVVSSVEKGTLQDEALLEKLNDFPPPCYDSMREILCQLDTPAAQRILHALEIKTQETMNQAPASSGLH